MDNLAATASSRPPELAMDGRRVYSERQSLHAPPAHDMRPQDLGDVRFRFELVPGAFGIDDHHRPVLAKVHAAGMVYSDPLDAERNAQPAHVVAELAPALGAAGTAPMRFRPFVDAAEHMHAIDGLAGVRVLLDRF